jgi:GrpB-like predicted nucleotidyltransferase (UPF0157 family)
VPGLAGKDKIDIEIVSDQHAAVSARLALIGYAHRGNLGIEGREVFDAPEADRPHNLYVCTPGALSLRNHLTVRDHPRKHPADATAYADLKRRLAEQFPFDRGAYDGHGNEVSRFRGGRTTPQRSTGGPKESRAAVWG